MNVKDFRLSGVAKDFRLKTLDFQWLVLRAKTGSLKS